MYLANTLSCAYTLQVNICTKYKNWRPSTTHCRSEFILDPAPPACLLTGRESVRFVSSHSERLSTTKAGLQVAARPYLDFRDKLTVQDQLVFKGPLVIILAAL